MSRRQRWAGVFSASFFASMMEACDPMSDRNQLVARVTVELQPIDRVKFASVMQSATELCMTEVLENWPKGGCGKPKPPLPDVSSINEGWCGDWACHVVDNMEDDRIRRVHKPGHFFVTDGEKYYDAECRDGVADWRHLPFFQRAGKPK